MRSALFWAVLAAVLAAVFLAGCQKPTEKACESSCLHYRKLQLAEELAAKAGGDAPSADKLDAAWKELRADDDTKSGLGYCIGLCRNESSPEQAACVLAAETVADADACLE